MTTVREIIVDAMEDILIQQEEAPIEADEANAAIRYLNDMMAMWLSQGIDLSYTEVSGLADTVTVVDGAKMGIKANLSIALAAKYGAVVSPALAARAVEGMKAIKAIAITAGEMEYPSILPMGSGNTEPGDEPFYEDLQEDIEDQY